MEKLRYVFAGGMTISHELLEFLCVLGHPPIHAFGYPPELAHRSNYRPLDDLGARYDFPVLNTKDINSQEVEQAVRQADPDWMFVFGWSQLVRSEILGIPRRGCLGFHMTKLPEGRGRAPLAWTLIKGKDEGGVSLIWLVPDADAGPIACQKTYPITVFDDAETVALRAAEVAVDVLREVVPDLLSGQLPRVKQSDEGVSHWDKRRPEDGLIDWTQSTTDIYNFIRGVAPPFPGAFTFLDGRRLDIRKAGFLSLTHQVPHGEVIGPFVWPGVSAGCGMAVGATGGIVILLEVSVDGSETMDRNALWQFASEARGGTLGLLSSR